MDSMQIMIDLMDCNYNYTFGTGLHMFAMWYDLLHHLSSMIDDDTFLPDW